MPETSLNTIEDTLEPDPAILIESLRDIGYSFNSALADIIDNSITANAFIIKIYAIPNEDDDDFKIAIIDDGDGLSHDDLKKAMRLGSTDPRQERALNDLGRFGLGLKTASFSQCRRLTVASRQDGQTSAFTWDLDRVDETKQWTIIEHADCDTIPFIEELGYSGTLVLWEKLDRLTGANGSGKVDFARLISEADDYLSLVFHRFLAGEKGLQKLIIKVNDTQLEPFDPFNSKNPATQHSAVEVIRSGVTLESFTLPTRDKYKSQQEYDKYGMEGGYLKNQGIYLYRAKRLILYGTWFGLAKKTALTQLNRVKIDIDASQDELWKIDVKKVSAQLPEDVRERIKTLINTLGAPSKRVYRKRATKLTSKESYPSWNVEKNGDGTLYKINRDHPVIKAFADSLDSDDVATFNTVLSLVESTFPREAIFYDMNKDENKVEFAPMDDDAFARSARTFFASFKQQGFEDETILSIMKDCEPFASRWDETLDAFGIEER